MNTTNSNKLALSSRKLIAVRNAARGGQYQLLLGAGASIGAANSHGPLPLAEELVEILSHRFPNAPIRTGDSLPRAYQRASMASSKDQLWNTFVEIFKGASHQSWFQNLANVPWRRVWTLNVDDTFENSYNPYAWSGRRSIRTINWDDPYLETGELEVVHLHGHIVGRAATKLIFSFSEYQAAAAMKPVWDQVLAGVLGVEPFVILGARILGDPDVEALISNNKPSATAPSFVVDPYIDSGSEWELERLGYQVLKITGEEFIKIWQDEMGLDEESVRALEERDTAAIPQFIQLQTNRVAPPPRAHDFLGGDAPIWADIVANRAAIFGWMKKIVDDVRSWLEVDPTPPSTLHIVYGDRMSGVSSGLYMAARALIGLHVDVYYFDKSSRFNVAKVLHFSSNKRPTAILIDSGADFANDADQLLRKAAQENVSLYILISESSQNDLRLEGRLTAAYPKQVTRVPRRLDRPSSVSLVRKLDEAGRLGSLELEEYSARIRHFNGRDVFSALWDVEHATGFARRLDGEVRALAEDWKKDLLLVLSIAAQGAKQVGIVDAAIAVGRPADRLSREIAEDEHLTAVIEVVDSRLLARQREHAIDALVRLMTPAEGVNRLREVIRNLAPLATRASLQQRNRPVQLVGYLMTAKQLKQNFPGVDLEREFYEPLLPLFGDWNGRYWEQRAIYSKLLSRWSTAESFAARSVALYDDPYSRTTYGTILINKAASFAANLNATWPEFYERGRDQFDMAIQKEPSNRVTVFAYLAASLELLESLINEHDGRDRNSTQTAVAQLRDDWERTYAGLRVTLNSDEDLESTRRAEALSSRWQSLVVRWNS